MKLENTAKSAVDAYIDSLNPPIPEMARALPAIVKESAPEAEETIKWRMLVYMSNGMLCCIIVAKARVSFIFYYGVNLSGPKGLLAESGKKLRSIKFREVKDIKKTILRG